MAGREARYRLVAGVDGRALQSSLKGKRSPSQWAIVTALLHGHDTRQTIMRATGLSKTAMDTSVNQLMTMCQVERINDFDEDLIPWAEGMKPAGATAAARRRA